MKNRSDRMKISGTVSLWLLMVAAVEGFDQTPAEQDPPTDAVAAEWRIFHDRSGAHKVEAVVQSVDAGTVRLRRKNGGEVVVPLDKLTPEDQQWIRQHAPATVTAAAAPADESPAWIADALDLVVEARQCLEKNAVRNLASDMPREIDGLERDLRLLQSVAQKGLEPLRAHWQKNRYDNRSAWISRLCAVGMPDLAEQLAKERGPEAIYQTDPLSYLGCYYLRHGNRAKAMRLFTEAATASNMVGWSRYPSARPAPGPLMLLAFSEPRDVDGALAVSMTLKNPLSRSNALLAVAQWCVDAGDRNKAVEVLRAAEEATEAGATSLPAATRCKEMIVPYAHLWDAYRDLDARKSDHYGDAALEAAGKLRDRLVAAATDNTEAEWPAESGGGRPLFFSTKEEFHRLAAAFYSGNDRQRGRAAFHLMYDAATKGVRPENACFPATEVAMAEAYVGEYAEAAAIINDIQDDPREDLKRCLTQSKPPATPAEAREFLTVFRRVRPEGSRDKFLKAFVMIGRVDDARKLAADCSDGAHMPVEGGAFDLARIAGWLAAQGKLPEAEKEMESIGNEKARRAAKTYIGEGLLMHGDLAGAVRYLDGTEPYPPYTSSIADKIEVEEKSGSILCRAASACLKAGRIDDAVRLATQGGGNEQLINELLHLGRMDDARKIAVQRVSHGPTPELLVAMCRKGQADDAIEVMKSHGQDISRQYKYPAKLAEIWAAREDPKAVAAWARKLEPAEERAGGLFGTARGIVRKHEPLEDDGQRNLP